MSAFAEEEASKASPEEAPGHSYESLRVTAAQKHVLHVQLNRPEKRNAMNKAFWRSGLQILEACLHEEAGAGALGRGGPEGRGFPPQTQPFLLSPSAEKWWYASTRLQKILTVVWW